MKSGDSIIVTATFLFVMLTIFSIVMLGKDVGRVEEKVDALIGAQITLLQGGCRNGPAQIY